MQVGASHALHPFHIHIIRVLVVKARARPSGLRVALRAGRADVNCNRTETETVVFWWEPLGLLTPAPIRQAPGTRRNAAIVTAHHHSLSRSPQHPNTAPQTVQMPPQLQLGSSDADGVGDDDLQLTSFVADGGALRGQGVYSLRFHKVKCRCSDCFARRSAAELKYRDGLSTTERFALGRQAKGYFKPHLWCQHVLGRVCRYPRAVLRLQYGGKVVKVWAVYLGSRMRAVGGWDGAVGARGRKGGRQEWPHATARVSLHASAHTATSSCRGLHLVDTLVQPPCSGGDCNNMPTPGTSGRASRAEGAGRLDRGLGANLPAEACMRLDA